MASSANRSRTCLERQPERYLHQPGLICLTGDLPLRAGGGRRHRRVRRTELRSVEQVERLRAERQIYVTMNRGGLRDRQIPVVDTLCAQIRVHTRLVTKLPSQSWIGGRVAGNEPRIGHAETGCVEPSIHAVERRSGDLLIAV